MNEKESLQNMQTTVNDLLKRYWLIEEKIASINRGMDILGNSPHAGNKTYYALVALEKEQAKFRAEREDLAQSCIEFI